MILISPLEHLSLFNSYENLHDDFRAILNKGESPCTVSAIVFPLFMIALINTARIKVLKSRFKTKQTFKI